MKIEKIRFKNLNSLLGEWEIDLTNQEYLANGIFLISGATGAGKTTILDAICLAIYGRTPRLDKISKNNNEIMSRRTASCFAEVTFRSISGRYRCMWMQKRAHEKVDGELQQPKVELCNADTNEILTTKINEMADKIIDLIGIDFKQFTRAVLLAQGGFAAFLLASIDERSSLLEKITGTDIYSKISSLVHLRKVEKEGSLRFAENEMKSVVLLTSEEENDLKIKIEQLKVIESELKEKIEAQQKSKVWLENINQMKEELAQLENERKILEEKQAQILPQRKKLALAQTLSPLDAEYAVLINNRELLQKEEIQFSKLKNDIPIFEKDVLAREEELKIKKDSLNELEESSVRELQLIQRVRILDQEYHDICSNLNKEKDQWQIEYKNLNESKKRLQRVIDAVASFENSLKINKEYLLQHAQDKSLTSEIKAFEEKLKYIKQQNKQQEITCSVIEKKEREYNNTIKNIDKANQKISLVLDKKKSFQTEIQELKESIISFLENKTLHDWEEKKEFLNRELILRKTIQDLESQRKLLENGKPCPLCGSERHPYALGNIPELLEVERKILSINETLAKVKNKQEKLTAEETNLNLLEKEISQLQQELAILNKEKDSLNNQLVETKDALLKLKAEHKTHFDALAIELKIYSVEFSENDLDDLLKQLKIRAELWVKNLSESEIYIKTILEKQAEAQFLQGEITGLEKNVSQKQQDLNRLENLKQEKILQREKLFLNKNTDTEETLIQNNLKRASEAYSQMNLSCVEIREKLKSIKEQHDNLLKKINEDNEINKRESQNFIEQLYQLGLNSEEQYLASRLTHSQRQELQNIIKNIDEELMRNQTMMKSLVDKLEKEEKQQLTTSLHADLLLEMEISQKQFDKIKEDLLFSIERLRQNTDAFQKIQEKQKIIEKQKEEFENWSLLHDLIGSSDGKKFRNFAQGLTFDTMIKHANFQLQKISDRYTLIRDDKEPLSLNVIDHYQADEIRTSKNLSGGESFLVSLALALGLSQMVSKNIKIDSLFLDEGFGTLDENALDAALTILGGLQQQGKLIGVISHVAVLKERISTHIQVLPLSGGKSKLVGPGCRNIS